MLNSLLSLWLMQRFGLSLAAAGVFFFCAGLLAAASQLAAPVLARRIGLVNTMVLTHLPANVCLVAAALAPTLPLVLALLLVRALLSQMDVPTRTAYVMSVVTPAERAAAASFTAVPRSLAATASPALAGALFAGGWLATPLVLCGVLKIGYDLALWAPAVASHCKANEPRARSALRRTPATPAFARLFLALWPGPAALRALAAWQRQWTWPRARPSCRPSVCT